MAAIRYTLLDFQLTKYTSSHHVFFHSDVVLCVVFILLSMISDGRKYYRGGYITRYHGSQYEGEVDAIQLEMPRNLRHEDDLRPAFARAVGRSIARFYRLNYQNSDC